MFAKIFQRQLTSQQVLKVTMLGHTGVGKTSLLAAIYDQFDQMIGKTNLQLTPEDRTKTILDNHLTDLKRMAAGDPNNPNYSIKVKDGLKGSTEPRLYQFYIGKTGVSPSVELQFQDYPGNYLKNKQQEVEKFIKESVAVLIAIDTPALLERNGYLHEDLNLPKTIYDLFKKAYKDLDSPRLVIIAPVKCEKYLQNSADEQKLLACIQEKYKNQIDFFRSDALSPYVAVVITPVQTVGSVICSAIERENEELIFRFRKISPNLMYHPKDCDQPLRYLLRFLIKLHLEHHKKSIFDFILNLFSRDTAFRDAVSEFANGCKNNGAFLVLQGSNLLRLKG